jgi:hypothetical protein
MTNGLCISPLLGKNIEQALARAAIDKMIADGRLTMN